MTNTQDELREYLRAFLAEKAWNVDELASRADVGRSTLYNFMSGSTSLGSSALARIASVTGDLPEKLYSLAGIPVSESEPRTQKERQLLQNFTELSDEDQERILLFVKALREESKREVTKKDGKRSSLRNRYQEP